MLNYDQKSKRSYNYLSSLHPTWLRRETLNNARYAFYSLRFLPNICLTGLDYRARWIRCILLQRGLQLSVKRSHERDQPRDSPDTGTSSEPGQSAQALLCAH